MLDAAAIDGILSEILPADVWEMYSGRNLGDALASFVELLVRWNRVVSLTSVRSSEEIVRRHIADSLCCAAILPKSESLLDLGSGAGFPGVPVQLVHPDLRVTLAESHGQKAVFLREVVRELRLSTHVFGGRAQDLPEGSFACVCVRAVDPMQQALRAAAVLASQCVCVVGSPSIPGKYGESLDGWDLCESASCTCDQAGSVVYRYSRHEQCST